MLYKVLKFLLRPAMFIFCRKVIVSNRDLLKEHGPLLLASNHPNSFLDAVILDMLFEQPVWSLARGDVFKNKIIAQILNKLRILPVFRTKEGTQHLLENYKTFDKCIAILENKGIVSIFSESRSINEWRLRKLKKGTARLAVKCWQQNIPLKVLPVGINYSSFRRFGKNVYLNFGNIITEDVIQHKETDGLQYLTFTERLNDELKKLVVEIPKEDKRQQKEKFLIKMSFGKKLLLLLPAIPGYLVHLPLYFPVQLISWKKAKGTGHYDSIVVALLFILYPFYLLAIVFVAWGITKSWYVFLLLLLLPFCAWSYVQLKSQVDNRH